MSNNTLGMAIGSVKQALSITNEANEKVSITVSIDFSTASDQDVRQWLTSNRIIAGQRPWRKLSKGELEALNGKTFVAQDVGRKVKSRTEQIQAFINAFVASGVDENMAKTLATAAIDNPKALKVIEDAKGLTETVVGDSDEN